MAELTIYATKYAYVERNGVNSHNQGAQQIDLNKAVYVLFRFPALAATYKYRAIGNSPLSIGLKGKGYAGFQGEWFTETDFNASTVTYDTVPAADPGLSFSYQAICGSKSGWPTFSEAVHVGNPGTGFSPGDLVKILRSAKTCVLRDFMGDRSWVNPSYMDPGLSVCTQLFAEDNSLKPYFLLRVSDSNAGAEEVSLQSLSYINPHVSNTFQYFYSLPDNTIEPIEVVTEKFFWRETGAVNWNEISVTPGAKAVTIAAETFPAASSVERFVRIVTNSGVTTDSAVTTSSTAAPLITATPSAPIATVEAADQPIDLTWTTSSASGFPQSKANLAWRVSGASTWTSLATVNGDVKHYTVAANTFPAGEIEWAVCAFNVDNTAGSWGYASFVAIAAPATPTVQCNARPFAAISWQADGQQGYQIELDGKLLGSFFGAGAAYQLQEPLSDGSHTIRVRVQNSYGLWSEWGEATVSIVNSPGRAVNLSGSFGVDASLSWETTAVYNNFMVYRDGVLIGFTHSASFVDRFALGEHEYFLINRFDSGYYTKSNTVKGKMCVRHPVAALLEGGDWISLRYSEKSPAEQRFSWSRTHSLRHIAGAAFPVLEISPYEDLSGTYDAAFLSAADAEAFRGLRGKVIVIKSPSSKVLVGALLGFSEVVNPFYLSFQFTIEQIAWEDYVDDTDS